jgi:hypothetical protein
MEFGRCVLRLFFDFLSKMAAPPCSLGSTQYVFAVPNGGFHERQV